MEVVVDNKTFLLVQKLQRKQRKQKPLVPSVIKPMKLVITKKPARSFY